MTYWILFGIDALVAAIVVVFFFIGLADGSVSSFNIVLWAGILAALGAVLWGAHALRSAGHGRAAAGLLAALALPGVIVGLFFLLLIVGQPDWK